MTRALTAVGLAAGLTVGAVARAGDFHGSVTIGAGGGGAGVAFGAVHLRRVVVIPPACPPPVVVHPIPPIRIVAPPPVVPPPPRMIVMPACPAPQMVVVQPQGFWRPPGAVVHAGHAERAAWKKEHRHHHR